MFIESWQIALVAIWIVYLLYRTSVWNAKVQQLSDEYERLLQSSSTKKMYRTKNLIYTILKLNQDVLKKAPKKMREKALEYEAERIIVTINNYNTDHYDYSPCLLVDELFGITPALVKLSDDNKQILNVDKTIPRLAERLEEMLSEDISYLEEE